MRRDTLRGPSIRNRRSALSRCSRASRTPEHLSPQRCSPGSSSTRRLPFLWRSPTAPESRSRCSACARPPGCVPAPTPRLSGHRSPRHRQRPSGGRTGRSRLFRKRVWRRSSRHDRSWSQPMELAVGTARSCGRVASDFRRHRDWRPGGGVEEEVHGLRCLGGRQNLLARVLGGSRAVSRSSERPTQAASTAAISSISTSW